MELFGSQNAAHRNGFGLAVRHFDADGALARNRGDDTDAQSGQTQRNIVLQVLDFRDSNAGGRDDFIQRDCRADGRLDFVDADAEFAQGFHNLVLVGLQFLIVDFRLLSAVVVQHVEGRELEVAEFVARVERRVDGMVFHVFAFFHSFLGWCFLDFQLHLFCLVFRLLRNGIRGFCVVDRLNNVFHGESRVLNDGIIYIVTLVLFLFGINEDVFFVAMLLSVRVYNLKSRVFGE